MSNLNVWEEEKTSNSLLVGTFDTLTSDEMFSWQRFAILAMFFTELQPDLDHCSVKKSPHKSSWFSRESISNMPGGVSLFVGR